MSEPSALELARCSTCGESKPLSKFPIWKKDGHLVRRTRCRDCRNASYRRPEARSRRNIYLSSIRKTEGKRNSERVHARKRQIKYPEKQTAKRLVRSAVEQGRLSKPELCEVCLIAPKPLRDGRSGLQAHHDDYSEPLCVRWLCHRCHIEEHRK